MPVSADSMFLDPESITSNGSSLATQLPARIKSALCRNDCTAKPVKAALAWKIIRGESTPKLNLEVEEIPQSGGGESVTLRFSVHTSGYLASGTTLHFGCTDTGEQDCEALAKALEETTAHVVRKDGLTREVTVQLEAPKGLRRSIRHRSLDRPSASAKLRRARHGRSKYS